MTLIAILIGLVAEHFLGHLEDIRRFGGLTAFADWVRERLPSQPLWEGPVGVLIAVGLPVLGVAVLQDVLHAVLFGLPGFLFGIAVLLFCLGPKNLDRQVQSFLEACAQGDEGAALKHTFELTGREPAAGESASYRTICEGVFVQANTRLFGVLFWFALLGPVGAVLYRITAVLQAHAAGRETGGFGDTLERLMGILDWLPARLAAAGFALSGSFEDAAHAWREAHRQGYEFPTGSETVLAVTGLGALAHRDPDAHEWTSEDVNTSMGLVWRTLIVWVTVIALMTLAGWAG